jgi:hypothetical protein
LLVRRSPLILLVSIALVKAAWASNLIAHSTEVGQENVTLTTYGELGCAAPAEGREQHVVGAWILLGTHTSFSLYKYQDGVAKRVWLRGVGDMGATASLHDLNDDGIPEIVATAHSGGERLSEDLPEQVRGI